MAKHSVVADWFSKLRNPRIDLEWLSQLKGSVDVIADFGCSSSEFLALLWYLDAAGVKVIEKEEENLSKPREELETIRQVLPVALEGRSAAFIVEDMVNLGEDQVPSDYCDLAYCEEVLYFMMPDLQKVQNSVNQMARVVRPGGWVIAVEKKIGAEVQEVEGELLNKLPGQKVIQCIPVSDPINLDPLFESVGLVKAILADAPEWSYCYRKPDRPPNTRL